ncbi:MAG: YfhO family protein [Bacteroidales bacterium]|nr:YfhO family protein [Bacteroidales bacterium]
MKEKLKGIIPHIIAIAAFILVSAIYFYPVMEGKALIQGDNIQAAGMAQEINKYEQTSGEYSAWTNSMFGGMPAYQIKSPESFNIHLMLQRFLHLFLPYSTMAIFFVYLLGFYLLLTSLKFKQGIAIIGAMVFALSSYNIIIIAAGHITKCYAIAYMAPVLAGIIHIFNKKYVLGFFMTTFALGIEIACNHPQILYYLAILCGVFYIWKAIEAFRTKKGEEAEEKISGKDFGKATAIAAIAVVFAVLPNITNLWTTWEYGKFSTRSQSELTSHQQSSGLDKDYAMAWSYGVKESFNMMIPDFKGGASTDIESYNQNALSSSTNRQLEPLVRQWGSYWGEQPFTSGPVYVGAVIIFLFVLGMFIVNNSAKWWMLAATILSLLMSWGKNFEFFNDIMFDYFPLYNKFRSVSMALVIAQVCIPFLAMIAIKELTDKKEDYKFNKKKIYWASGITAGICLIFAIFPSLSGDFISTSDNVQWNRLTNTYTELTNMKDPFFSDLTSVRKQILSSDAWRSLVFILIAAALVMLYVNKILKSKALIIAIGVVAVFDLWTVDVRYLSSKDYHNSIEVSNMLRPTLADEFIMKDTDPNYRVLNLTANVFNDARTSYFHKSIGGYHGAKMRRYQEFIDTLLGPTVDYAMQLASRDRAQFENFVKSSQALNMLNTKHIILGPTEPYVNLNTFGNAWFVNKFVIVENADQEISSLNKNDLSKTAIINKNKFEDYMAKLPKDQIYAEDSSAIVLTEYKPNHITYEARAFRDRLAVFSEIYYPKGWQAYIDGQPAEHINADYILRAMVIPQGDHRIEFKFDPASVRVGKIIAAVASSLILLALLAFVVMYYKSKNSIVEDVKKQ